LKAPSGLAHWERSNLALSQQSDTP
jgi:hypothetical protein